MSFFLAPAGETLRPTAVGFRLVRGLSADLGIVIPHVPEMEGLTDRERHPRTNAPSSMILHQDHAGVPLCQVSTQSPAHSPGFKPESRNLFSRNCNEKLRAVNQDCEFLWRPLVPPK